MMKNRKMRLAVFLSVLMLLVMPLLSSPVAAAVTFETWAITNNGNGGVPNVFVGKTTIDTDFTDSGTVTITVTCETDGTDASGNPETPSSKHYVLLTIQRKSPTTGPLKSDSNTEYLNSGQNYGVPDPVVLQVTDQFVLQSGGNIIWEVIVYAKCEDLPSTDFDEQSDTWDITVTE